jgi:hypothetical protein
MTNRAQNSWTIPTKFGLFLCFELTGVVRGRGIKEKSNVDNWFQLKKKKKTPNLQSVKLA